MRWPGRLFALLVVVSTPRVADAQLSPWAASRDEDLQVSLVTFGPGAEIHQYFGHNAMIVQDRVRNLALLYNFGMFSFGSDMLPKYLQGQLEFWVAATPVRSTFRLYVAMDRSITVQELDLSPARRRRIADRLAWNALPENRAYRYHHYRDNCSTRLRDLLDDAVDGQMLKEQSRPARLNYRGHTRRYTEHDPIVHMLLFFWMNDSMERPIRSYDEAFLPDELARVTAETTYRDEAGVTHQLVSATYTVYQSKRPKVPYEPSVVWPAHLATGLLIGLLALALAEWWRRAGRLPRVLFGLLHVGVGVVFGVPSLVAFLFVFTEWKVTFWNENLWAANPLTFFALPAGVALCFGARWAERWLRVSWLLLAAGTLLLCVLKLLPSFDQDTHLTIALALPTNLGFAAAFWRKARALPTRAPTHAPT